MTPDEIRRAFTFMQSKVHLVDEYDLFRERRYINPHGYLSYENTVKRSCAVLWSYQIGGKKAFDDFISRVAAYLFQRAARERAPAYWLSSNLQTALLQCDIPLGS